MNFSRLFLVGVGALLIINAVSLAIVRFLISKVLLMQGEMIIRIDFWCFLFAVITIVCMFLQGMYFKILRATI